MALSEQDKKDIIELLGRTPSVVETHIFDAMWSEHCSYKSSKPTLKTLPTTGSEVALGIGEDAGLIRFTKHNGKQYCIAISHESHNHPSQILPIEGAATGVGGCVRDVYCMGADVVGVLNSLHFGISNGENPIVDEIADKVIYGISDYGNPLGVPVLGGETLYHESYNDNCLVNVAALGLVEEDNIIHSYVPAQAKHEPYDVILFGKSTDATGFGGASFSSATLDNEDKATNVGAVQVHDPFLKRVLVEAIKVLIKKVKDAGVEIGFKDLGAGGISCATSEIAVGGGFGIAVDLDKVNTILSDLPPEVVAASETQERFCVAVPRHFSQTVCDIFNQQFELPNLYPNAGAVVIGEILQEKLFTMTYRGEEVCHLPVESITTEVTAKRSAKKRTILKESLKTDVVLSESIETVCQRFLNKKNNASKKYVYRFFDNAVRGDTVIYPGEADAVVVTPIDGCSAGLAVSMDSNLYGLIDPYVAGAYAVAESVRNVISVGAIPIALTDCLNYGNPEKESVFFDFQEGVRGIKEAAEALSFIPGEPVPIISGNVSFYNESKEGSAVTPSPVVCCIGRVDDFRSAKTMQCIDPGLHIYVVGKRYAEFAGTQIEPYCESIEYVAPQVRLAEEKAQNQCIVAGLKEDKIETVHDISMGGVWQAVVEMLLGESGNALVGAALRIPVDVLISMLFSENGGYVVAIKEQHAWEAHCAQYQVSNQYIGETVADKAITINQSSRFELMSLKDEWTAYHV